MINLNQDKLNVPLSPIGSLKAHIDEWKNIGANDYIISIIENGYKLPLKQIPESTFLDNNKSEKDNMTFVSKEVENLLQKVCISTVAYKPHVVNPLTLVYNKSSKPSLVLDCRHINPHLFQFKFKYEDGYTTRKIFEKGDYIFSFDLKSAYHNISIYKSRHRTYLGF